MKEENKFITPENRTLIAVITSLILLMLLIGVMRLLFFDLTANIELKTYDWRAKIAAGKAKSSDDIVLLVVDDISLQNAVSNPELGLTRWPWPRSVHADIVNYMKKAGAKLVVFDIIFEGAEGTHEGNKQSDQLFVEATESAGNVILASSFTYSNLSLKNYTNKEQIKQNILNISSPELKLLVKKFALNSEHIHLNNQIIENIEFYNVANILPGLLKNVYGFGSVTLPPSKDGIIRMTRPLTYFQDAYYPSLPLAVYLVMNPSAKYRAEGEKFYIDDRKIPLTDDGASYINWYGSTGTFKHYRALDIILAQKAYEAGQMKELDNRKFKDKIVIVGLTAAATDILPTPMNDAYPGPEVVASVINNYMSSGKFIAKVGIFSSTLITIILVIIIGFCIFRIKSGLAAILISLSIIGLYVYLTVFNFVHNYLWLEMFFPSLVMFFAITITFMSKYVTTRKAFEDTYHLATTDGLTGLYNHRFFQESINGLIKRCERYKQEFSLLIVDIDYFKQINDTYGHRAGDRVLKEISDRIKSIVRVTDIVARYGGEEIVIILDNTGFENSLIVAHKVLRVINSKEYYLKPGVSLTVTVSVGIASYPRHGKTSPEIIEIADQGLYFAKENGRNRIGTLEDKLEMLSQADITDIKLKPEVDINIKLDYDQYENILKAFKLENQEDVADWFKKKIEETSNKEL
jgi:diguanylate cyclase (GGDEF)-like protein